MSEQASASSQGYPILIIEDLDGVDMATISEESRDTLLQCGIIGYCDECTDLRDDGRDVFHLEPMGKRERFTQPELERIISSL